MAYSPNRLSKAQHLFSSPTRTVFDPGDGYDLRSRAKNTTSTISSWVDNDKDDDYIPPQSSRTKRRIHASRETRSRTRPAKHARSHSPRPKASPKADTNKDAPSAADPVTIADTTGQSQWERLWEPLTERDPSKAYFFRARKHAMGPPGSGAKLDQNRQSMVSKKGRPSLKGCLACQEINLDCSLVDNPFHYPCDNCRDDECDCIPDPPPIWKRQCELCKRRRLPQCSYLSGNYDHSKPCHECLQHGFQCVAGPAKYPPHSGHSPESMDIEMTDVAQATEPPETLRRYPMRYAKGKSQAQESPNSLPVRATGNSRVTAIQNQSSTQHPLPSGLRTLAGSDPVAAAIPSFPSSGPNPYGTSYRISTYYPHPLTLLDMGSIVSCHWCLNWAYGIVGLGIRNTEVLDFNTGRLIEIKDGHQGEGREPSRMCWLCASERVQIMQCPHDNITPIMNRDPKSPKDRSAAFQNLAQARAALQEPTSQCYGQPFQTVDREWCSLCQEPASWSCDSDQTAQAARQGDSEFLTTVGIGCGLYLCHYCAYHVKRFRGDLDRAVAWGKQDPENENDLRADVEYILKKSKGNCLRRQVYKN